MILKASLSIIIIGILYLSLTPTETLTVGNDKISHFIAYSCLMLNIGLIQLPSIKKLRTGIIAALLLGCLVEVIQHFVPGRFMSFGDVIANTMEESMVGYFADTKINLFIGVAINSPEQIIEEYAKGELRSNTNTLKK